MKDISRHYVISRHINGIVLNPLEYVLDDNGELRLFNTEEDAKKFICSIFKNLDLNTVEEIEEEYGWYITLAEQDLDTLIRGGETNEEVSS